MQDHSARLTDINENLRGSNFLLQSKVTDIQTSQNNNNNNDSKNDITTERISVDLNDLDLEVKDLEEEINVSNSLSNENENEIDQLPQVPQDPVLEETLITVQPSNPDKKDPNRPRYTLKEMQTVVEERNIFKIKMIALEEELELFKGGG